MLLNEFNTAEMEALWFLCVGVRGAHFASVFRNGWMMDSGDTFHPVLCLYCCATDRI